MKKAAPFALILAGTVGMALYPRVLGPDAAAVLRSDGIVGFVHGICLGLEVLAVMMLANVLRLKPTRR